MALCTKCGSSLPEGAAFCSVCGSPVSSPSSRPQNTEAGMASNVAAALCYFVGLITGIIFLAIEPYRRDPFVRFHAFQSIFFSVAVIAFWIIWSNLIWAAFFSVTFLLPIFGVISSLIGLAIFVYWLFLMYKAYNREKYKIPVIGDLAVKQIDK